MLVGGLTPVSPAPPVTTWAAAGPARTRLRAPASAIVVRFMRLSMLLLRHWNGRGVAKFDWARTKA